MPKIFYIGITFVTIASLSFAAVYFLLPNNDHEIQVPEKNIQNVSINNQEKKEIQEVEKEKSSNKKIIIYSIIGLLILVVIIGVVIFLLPKCRKNKKALEVPENPSEDLITSTEEAVKNFINIKGKTKNLFANRIYFIAHVKNKSKIISEIYNIEKNKKNIGETHKDVIFGEEAFLEISKSGFAGVINYFINKEEPDKDKDLKDISLNMLEPEVNKEQIEEKFKNCKGLLDLILIIRLGVFGKLDDINKLFRDGNLLYPPNELQLELDAENMEENNDIFLGKISDSIQKKGETDEKEIQYRTALNFLSAQRNDFINTISSLIGGEENGYQVNEDKYKILEEKYNFLNKENNDWFYPLTINNDGEIDFFPCCTMFFSLFKKIQLILIHAGKELVKNENLHWRIIIRKIVLGYQYFSELCISMKEKSKNFNNKKNN